jgi:hypothetical protein
MELRNPEFVRVTNQIPKLLLKWDLKSKNYPNSD